MLCQHGIDRPSRRERKRRSKAEAHDEIRPLARFADKCRQILAQARHFDRLVDESMLKPRLVAVSAKRWQARPTCIQWALSARSPMKTARPGDEFRCRAYHRQLSAVSRATLDQLIQKRARSCFANASHEATLARQAWQYAGSPSSILRSNGRRSTYLCWHSRFQLDQPHIWWRTQLTSAVRPEGSELRGSLATEEP